MGAFSKQRRSGDRRVLLFEDWKSRVMLRNSHIKIVLINATGL